MQEDAVKKMKLITEFHLLQGLYDHHELCGYCAVIVRLLCGASEYFLKILWKLNKKEIDCQLTVYFLLDLSSLSCLQAKLTNNV